MVKLETPTERVLVLGNLVTIFQVSMMEMELSMAASFWSFSSSGNRLEPGLKATGQ